MSFPPQAKGHYCNCYGQCQLWLIICTTPPKRNDRFLQNLQRYISLGEGILISLTQKPKRTSFFETCSYLQLACNKVVYLLCFRVHSRRKLSRKPKLDWKFSVQLGHSNKEGKKKSCCFHQIPVRMTLVLMCLGTPP